MNVHATMGALSRGDYAEAFASLQELDHLARSGGAIQADVTPERAMVDAARAEMYFYKGEHHHARSILEPYATNRALRRSLRSELPPLIQLQLVQYFYSWGSYDKARTFAEVIEHVARVKGDDAAAGAAILQQM